MTNTQEDELKKGMKDAFPDLLDFESQWLETKRYFIKKGQEAERNGILKRILDLLSYDWNNENLKLLRDELKEQIKEKK